MVNRQPGAPPRPNISPQKRVQSIHKIRRRMDSVDSTRGALLCAEGDLKAEASLRNSRHPLKTKTSDNSEEMQETVGSDEWYSDFRSPNGKMCREEAPSPKGRNEKELTGSKFVDASLQEMEGGSLLQGSESAYNSLERTPVGSSRSEEVRLFSTQAMKSQSWAWQSEQSFENPASIFSIERYKPCVSSFLDYVGQANKELMNSFLYDPDNIEFTTLQQHCWAAIIGVIMGIFTAKWGDVIEWSVELVWKEIPAYLLEIGIFTDLDGRFPLPHYMWICPSIFGGVLSYATAILAKSGTPIPGQNEWIESLHIVGILDHTTLLMIIVISTLGMASGLSLGPELPLVLVSGMAGSYLSLCFQQSILSSRVMNLTAASAAIAGFFGFPLAGALFVLEIPHRMGLQYFEALSPATLASIAAVIVNRFVTGKNVTGKFHYPSLTGELPNGIFWFAIIYGVFGSMVGFLYSYGCKSIKVFVHDLFHHHEPEKEEGKLDLKSGEENEEEFAPLFGPTKQKDVVETKTCCKSGGFTIKHEPVREAVVGVIAGALVGVICMFVPHALFWGEAQLQTFIDNGKTPLPVFGKADDPTADLTAYGYCLIDHTDPEQVEMGYGTLCSFTFIFTKILTIGLSLGTGIVGGHFWGPLYVGAVAAQFLNHFVSQFSYLPFTHNIIEFPCVSLLCIMGASHVVTFRAHIAIMLILTLTISTPIEDARGGDYSTVFPLLVVSCFISLMLTRKEKFYKTQRSRGDIIAAPQVLCEPRKQGQPHYVHYDDYDDNYIYDSDSSYSNLDCSIYDDVPSTYSQDDSISPPEAPQVLHLQSNTTQDDIEQEFQLTNTQENRHFRKDSNESGASVTSMEFTPNTVLASPASMDDSSVVSVSKSTSKEIPRPKKMGHRRIRSGSDLSRQSQASRRGRKNSRDGRPGSRESSPMPVLDVVLQPDIMTQGRQRAASLGARKGNAPPMVPKAVHRRNLSGTSVNSNAEKCDALTRAEEAGAIPQQDVEKCFYNIYNQNQYEEMEELNNK